MDFGPDEIDRDTGKANPFTFPISLQFQSDSFDSLTDLGQIRPSLILAQNKLYYILYHI